MKTRQDAWTEENDLLLAETVLRHVREGSTQLNAFEEVGDKLNRTSAACGFRWNAVVRHQYEKALQLAKKQRKQRQRILGKDQGGKKKLLYQPSTPSFEDLEAMDAELGEEYVLDSPVVPKEMVEQKEEQTEPMVGAYSPLPERTVKPTYSSPLTATAETKPMPSHMNLEKVIAYLQQMGSSTYQTDILKSENQRLKHEITDLRRENIELQKKVSQLEKNSITMQEDYETLMQIMNRARKLVLFEEENSSPSFKMDRNGNLEKMAE
ncbi:Prespore-specific transcriptional regulator RsfA [Bacillus coahuilensis p1.1.43]|uniref:Prespore-specific transcriptional regulator RsfA n=1 Tax=Bacillus coahuilensis p1.1.43 TaxID=1150625 RepID=A0A147K448_9BACI|nr:RsfA family transcriptional regulator [Bacillus coahuilensis]KUP04058.1 Prespore-specific transcriptional regulator RsfA [Bacillus coahuilensis p1.1.43]